MHLIIEYFTWTIIFCLKICKQIVNKYLQQMCLNLLCFNYLKNISSVFLNNKNKKKWIKQKNSIISFLWNCTFLSCYLRLAFVMKNIHFLLSNKNHYINLWIFSLFCIELQNFVILTLCSITVVYNPGQNLC